MKFILLSSLLFSASAFIAPRSPTVSSNRKELCTARFSTNVSKEAADTTTVSVDGSISVARGELLSLATELKDQNGLILIDSNAKDSFRKAVEKLESVAEVPTDSSLLIGDWSLLCSSSSSTASEKLKIDTSKIPFVKDGPIQDIKNTLNDSVEVIQRIKFGEESNSIDEVDHIIDYKPPNKLSSFLKNVPDAIKDLDINPLKVSETKVVLKHKAEIEGLIPNIKTKLNLQSVVVNVAGESKNLEPNGEDVLGINLPFGDLLNAGSFETTFLDDSMRISRSKTGPVNQLRVFVRTTTTNSDSEAVDSEVVDDNLDDDEIVDDDDDIVEEDSDSSIDTEVAEEDDDDETIEAPSDIEN